LIGIDTFPGCGFGNRVIYYYNLRQEAYSRGLEYFSVQWEGSQYFEENMLGSFPPKTSYESFPFCLGDRFFEDSGISTREVFRLKPKVELQEGTCAVHFRGTDFHSWNPDSILDSNYYLESLDSVKGEISNCIVFTDDAGLKSYQDTINFLSKEGIPFLLGENTSNRLNYIKDFAIMSECDYIISSPSTFNICAGFIGKKKRIIHSNSWVKDRVSKEDKFWTDLESGGNDDYKIWRLI